MVRGPFLLKNCFDVCASLSVLGLLLLACEGLNLYLRGRRVVGTLLVRLVESTRATGHFVATNVAKVPFVSCLVC